MTQWKDEKKRYGSDEISSSKRKLGRFKLSIHRHIDYPPDAWLATCYGVFDRVELKPKDLTLAKGQATAMVQVVLEDAIKDIIGE